MKRIEVWLKRAAWIAAACAVLALAWLVTYATSELAPPQTPLQFSVQHGASLRSVARQLTEAGVLREPLGFVVLARLLGKAGSIKAGNYEIPGGITPYALLAKLTQGDYMQDGITFVEGWTFRQVRKALDEHRALRHDTAGLSDAEILRRLGIDLPSLEGLFFPDTYFFSSGASDFTILKRAHALMQSQLAAQWANRAPELPLASPYEALILASIIEKETGAAGERELIAAVFVNRLRLGMKLQADPAVIYGMGERFDGNLRRQDLRTPTPYNTYTRGGLPPTPIALPGRAAIEAVLNPAQTRALYFVSRGDGSSEFSEDLAAHNRAVARYQLGRASSR